MLCLFSCAKYRATLFSTLHLTRTDQLFMSQLHFREKRRQTFFKINKDKSEEKLWPLTTPGVDEIVDSGFYFTPTKKFPDQVTCFWCGKKEKNLDGEESFKTRHLSNNRRCPYSLISLNMDKFVNDKKQETFWQNLIADGAPLEVADPLSHQSIALRRSTFKKLWKFDSRKNAKVSSQSLAAAGFYFSPLELGNDRVLCMYCDCSLDEWSPDDDPFEEHRVNSPTHCYFLETLSRKKNAKHLSLESKTVASPPSPMNVNKRSRTPPNSMEEDGFSDDDAYDFSIDQIEDPTAKHVPEIRSLRPRQAVKRANDTLVSQSEKTSLVLQVTHGVDNNSSRELDGASQDMDSPAINDMVIDKGSDANSILSYSDDNYVESYSESSPEKPSELPRSLRLRARNLASKKRQSQFSDEDVELNLEAILNSPKKDRKIRKLQTKGEPLTGPDFFDDSNHNIGDYNEENIDYLESKVSSRKSGIEVSNGIHVGGSKPPKLSSEVVSLPPEVIEVKSSPSPEGAKGKPTASATVHIVKRSQFSSPEKFDGLFMDTKESPLKEDALGPAKSQVEFENPSSFDVKKAGSRGDIESADQYQQMNPGGANSDAMFEDDAKEEASIRKENKHDTKVQQEDTSMDAEAIEVKESEVKKIPHINGLLAESSPAEMAPSEINTTDRLISNQDSPSNTTPVNGEEMGTTVASQSNREAPDGSVTEPGLASGQDEVTVDEATEIPQEFKTTDSSSALHSSNVQEVSENAPKEDKCQNTLPDSQLDIPENGAVVETPTVSNTEPFEVKAAGSATNEAGELSVEQQEVEETIDLNVLVEDEKGRNDFVYPDPPNEVESVASNVEFESAQQNEKEHEHSEEIVDDTVPSESKRDSSVSGVKDSPKRQSQPDDKAMEAISMPSELVDEVAEPLAVDALPVFDSGKAASPKIPEDSQVHDGGDSVIPDSVSDLAPFTSVADAVDEGEISLPRDSQKTEQPEQPSDEIQRIHEKEDSKIVEEQHEPTSATALQQLRLSDFSQGDLDASTPRNSGSHHILQDKSVTTERNPKQDKRAAIEIPKIHHLDSEILLNELDVLLDTIAYLAEISATRQELYNDTEGHLTRFIASLPEEEENMTIEEWILHNAKTCGDTVRQISNKVVAAYEAKYDEIIARVRALPTLD